MRLTGLLPFAASAAALGLAIASVIRAAAPTARRPPTPTRRPPEAAAWCFAAGMVVLAADSLFTGLALRAPAVDESVRWLARAFTAKCLVPAAWLCFSVTWSRGDPRGALARWTLPLVLLGALPALVALWSGDQVLRFARDPILEETLLLQFAPVGRILNAALLVALVLVLMNLEQTYRSAVGTMRWQVKFVVLGLAVIFATQLYVRSQWILFSIPDLSLAGLESSALLIGCAFLAVAYARTGLAGIDVYPSSAVLRSSLTILLAGGYLFIVGVLAQVVKRLGGGESFELQAFVVLLGMAGLAVLLLSNRLRQRLQAFVARHFRKAQHDSVRVWTLFSQRLAHVTDTAALCAVTTRSVSETLDTLSVTTWLADEGRGTLRVGGSTSRQPTHGSGDDAPDVASSAVGDGLRTRLAPFDLDAVDEAWTREFRDLNPAAFREGGHRWCVPLRAGERSLGALVLGDRVNGAPYSTEEVDLLRCIGEHVSSVLVNLRLAGEVAQARELEAFRTMSAFFVHDLKNAAASLNLTLRNLPVHFDDPAFRQDALRVVGNTARRIDEIIARLSALRDRPAPRRVETDLHRVVREAIDEAGSLAGMELAVDLQPVPGVLADADQLRSVVTNLVLNARDAIGTATPGRIEVQTQRRGPQVVISVSDTGCGMTPAFVRDSLFRPFQSTKKKGLGIGLFQARLVVEAHGGTIAVESEPGKGTTFHVSLPSQEGAALSAPPTAAPQAIP